MITLEEFKKEKIAINTRTQEKYSNLMKLFDSKDKLWCGVKSLSNQTFDYSRENTCILCTIHRFSCGGKNYALGYDSKSYCEKEGYKIITPTQLKEYNEFMGKPKYITTHAELLKLHGRSITCKIEGVYVGDAKISVGGQGHNTKEMICICCNISKNMGVFSPTEPLGYKQAIWISMKSLNYENDNRKCTEIKLKEQTQYLTIGQAIDYMRESEKNVIEYLDSHLEATYIARIKNKDFEQYDYECKRWHKDKCWREQILLIDAIKNWTKIKKHIEPKQTTKETKKTPLELFKQGKAFVEIKREVHKNDIIDKLEIISDMKAHRTNAFGDNQFLIYCSRGLLFCTGFNNLIFSNKAEIKRFLTEIKGMKEIQLEDLEPKQKTIKEKMEAKETFQYKDKWYRFNKDGVILNKMSSKPVELDKIKELLKQCEE